jgi:hypothetical protein
MNGGKIKKINELGTSNKESGRKIKSDTKREIIEKEKTSSGVTFISVSQIGV